MSSPIRQLLALITENVDKLEKACAAKGTPIPDLHEPFHPASEAFRADPKAGEAANVICAAALQLEAILGPPQVSLYHMVGGVSASKFSVSNFIDNVILALQICCHTRVHRIQCHRDSS